MKKEKNKGREFEVLNSESWPGVVPALWDLSSGKRIWLLEGDLGSGKTTLARYLIQYLGSEEHVTSPTYSLINEYEWIRNGERFKFFHLDLYRLETVEELLDIGFEELLDGDDMLFIEWPEIAENLLPDDCFRLKISHLETHRKVLVL